MLLPTQSDSCVSIFSLSRHIHSPFSSFLLLSKILSFSFSVCVIHQIFSPFSLLSLPLPLIHLPMEFVLHCHKSLHVYHWMFFLRCFCSQPKVHSLQDNENQDLFLFPCLFITNFSTFPVREKKQFYTQLEPENNPNSSTHKTPSKLSIWIQLILSSPKKSFPF